MTRQVRHLYHRHGAVWCGYSAAQVVSTRDAAAATCEDCREVAARFAGADPACGCQECAS